MRWRSRGWLGEATWGHTDSTWDKHTHPHPATPRERLCPQQELHPRKSREQLGDAASFGKAGRCFGSGMAARIGNLDWELVGFSHQISQFWHGVLFPNPFLQHYPMGWIWFSSCLGFWCYQNLVLLGIFWMWNHTFLVDILIFKKKYQIFRFLFHTCNQTS